MSLPILIPPINEALLHLINRGFSFDSGKIYIFDSKKAVVCLVDIINGESPSFHVSNVDMSPDVLFDELYDYTIALLKANSNEKIEFSKMLFPRLQKFQHTGNVSLPLTLNEDKVSLVIFSRRKIEKFDGTPDLISEFGQLLRFAINAWLRDEKIRKLEQELKILNNENHQKSQLIDLGYDLAAVRSVEDFVAIADDKLSDQALLGEFFISLIDDGIQSDSSYIHSTKNLALFNNHQELNQTADNTPDTRLMKRAFDAKNYLVLNIKDLMQAGNLPQHLAYWYSRGIKKMMGIPLIVEKVHLAVLWIYLDERNPLTKPRIQLIKGLGAQITIALLNIKANKKINKQLFELSQNKQRLEVEKLYLVEAIDNITQASEVTSSSPAMLENIQLIRKVAPTNSTVLILGETGTGKELVARAIHHASLRKDKIMIKINCAALPHNLIESELFGHERGSFTGALDRHIGKFELANNGTLFLDEIGDMPVDAQIKLLRAIQEKEIERIGGKSVIKVNVRIIAATNRNLPKAIAEGRFRSDLFYRLNVFPITVPPLRDRKEDIAALTTHFVEKFARQASKKIDRVSEKVLQILMTYDWPGNVRELEHLMERSVLLAKGPIITQVDILFVNKKFKKVPEQEIIKTMEENERDHIIYALKKSNGKVFGKGGAADLLGMHFSTLNSRIKKLEIQKGVIIGRRS